MAQDGQDPALGNQHAVFHLGLVPGASGTGRQNADAVVAGHVGIGRIDLGLVATRSANRALQTIGDHDLRHAAKVIERSGMGTDPVRELLSESGFGEGIGRRAPDGDKELGCDRIAGLGID